MVRKSFVFGTVLGILALVTLTASAWAPASTASTDAGFLGSFESFAPEAFSGAVSCEATDEELRACIADCLAQGLGGRLCVADCISELCGF